MKGVMGSQVPCGGSGATRGAPSGLALLAHLPRNRRGRWGLPKACDSAKGVALASAGAPLPDPSPANCAGEGGCDQNAWSGTEVYPLFRLRERVRLSGRG